LPSDEHGNFTTAVLLRRNINGKDQRIIAASDADYLTKAVVYGGYKPKRYNYDFGFWCFSYFSYGQFPANTLRPQTDDSMDIKVGDFGIQEAFLYYIIPLLIAILGSVVLIRRKRK
jgi:ABC-2 type transport system permease protein